MDETLTLLGRPASLPASPEQARLERIANPHPADRYLVRFTCPEFTALCPITGQPDFAHLVIDIVPAAWLLESKSLKLYLASFRNHGAFHEDLHARDRAPHRRPAGAGMAAHRRLLVSTGRHPDRRVLADRCAAGRGVATAGQEVAPYRGRG